MKVTIQIKPDNIKKKIQQCSRDLMIPALATEQDLKNLQNISRMDLYSVFQRLCVATDEASLLGSTRRQCLTKGIWKRLN